MKYFCGREGTIVVMKKIGIITFHRAENFGAFLQTYALQTVLQQIAPTYRVEVIDYQPKALIDCYKLNRGGWHDRAYSLATNFIRGIQHFYKMFVIYMRKQKFRKAVMEKLSLSHPIVGKSEYISYRTIVLGSDQIWNPKITGGVNEFYYGRVEGVDAGHIISYAASLGELSFSEEEEKKVSGLLQGINAISVREASHASYVRKLAKVPVEVVADPTLLLQVSFWEDFEKHKKRKPYILYYSLQENKEMWETAWNLAKKKGLQLLVIDVSPVFKKNRDVKTRYIYGIGPQEFLGLVKEARYIFTNSFHATCFSILFRKTFYTYPSRERGKRIEDLLSSLKLEQQIGGERAKNGNDISENVYQNAMNQIEDMKKNSEHFLVKNLL